MFQIRRKYHFNKTYYSPKELSILENAAKKKIQKEEAKHIESSDITDIQSFEDEFRPIGASTPKSDLETEYELRSDFNEKADQLDIQSFESEFRPIRASTPKSDMETEYELSDFNEKADQLDPYESTIYQGIEDNNLTLKEKDLVSETLKHSDSLKPKIYTRKKSQHRQHSKMTERINTYHIKNKNKGIMENTVNQIGCAKTRKRRCNSTPNNFYTQDKKFPSAMSSDYSGSEFETRTPFEIFQDTQLNENDSEPQTMTLVKKISKPAQNFLAKSRSNLSTQPNRKLKIQKHKNEGERNTEIIAKNSQPAKNRNQRRNPTFQNCSSKSSKENPIERSRKTFKTLGYCPQSKGQNLPICDITTLKEDFLTGLLN